MATTDVTAERRETDVFTRHRGPVTCAAVVPGPHGEDAERIVSSGYDGAVAVVDVPRRTIALLGYHDHLVNRIVLSSTGRLAASASSDYTIGLWDMETSRLVRFLRGHSDDVEDFVFVNDNVGISASRDRRVLVWDLRTGAILRTLVGHERDVLSVVYADAQIFTSSDDMTLRVWSLTTGELLRRWGPFEHETDTCAIDIRRRRAILGCDDGVFRVFSIDTGDTLGEIHAHTSGIKIVAVSPTTGDIFSAAYDRRLIIWDADRLTERLALDPVPSVWERSFNWTLDGTKLVAGTFDGTVVGWSASDGRQLFEIGSPGGNACLNEVASAADRIAAVADDGYVRLGRLTRNEAAWVARREPHAGRVLANAVTIDERAGVIVAGFHDQTLRIFSLDLAMDEMTAVDLREGPINSIRALSIDGRCHIFAACYSGRVVHLTSDGEILARLRVHDGAVKSLRLLPSRELGLSCSADGSAYGWSLQTGARQMAFPAHTAIVNDLDVDLAGRRVATVGRDFVLNVYSLENGRLLQAYPLGRRSPKAVVFAAGDAVMVGDYWGHIGSISLADGAISRRRIAQNGISSLTRHRPGEVLASSYDGAVFLVDVETTEVIGELRAMRQRVGAVAASSEVPR
jgi:WD40 repeat protein